MKLYYSPGACSWASHIVLDEVATAAGFAYETQLVSAMDGSASKPEHLARNPKAQVPVLEVSGNEAFTLTEGNAIMVYLANRYPQAKLLSGNAAQLARTMEWLSWLSSAVHAQHVGMIWRAGRFSDDATAQATVTAKGKTHIAKSFATIDAKLAGKTWAVDEQFGVVDAFLVVFYRWGNRMGIDMAAQHPAWAAHTARMLARASVQKTMALEGIAITG